MIILFIAVFTVMLAAAFLVGCGIGELEIMWEEREEHECTDQWHEDA